MKISIILPEKNQGAKLLRHLRESILPYFDAQKGLTYDVLISPNGCSEEEMQALELAAPTLPAQVKILPNAMPGGKGLGIQKGIEASDSDYVLFMDADLATDLSTFEKFAPYFGKADAIIASRDMPDSSYGQRQTFKRTLTHWGGRMLIKACLRMPFKDTQCGFKAYRTDVAKEMVKKQRFNGFSFDLEYLYFLVLNGFSVKEIGCHWTDDPDSTISHNSVFVRFYEDMMDILSAKESYRLDEERLAKLKGGKHAH